jgi:hypothetical protein
VAQAEVLSDEVSAATQAGPQGSEDNGGELHHALRIADPRGSAPRSIVSSYNVAR